MVMWLRVGRLRLAATCLRTANRRAILETMNTSTERFVVVPAAQLDDLLELSRLAVDQLPDSDPLALALRGANAQVRVASVLEPGR